MTKSTSGGRDRRKLIVFLALFIDGTPAQADCIDDAARYQHVDPYLLRAIAYHESRMRPATLTHNTNGTVDVGVMGINSVHFEELTGYGIAPYRLRDACTNAYIGAYYLRLKIDKYGPTWKAVAAYHSETPDKGAAYANAIRIVMAGWGLGWPRN
nr:lytic transglycosylase domain-containing protein [Luteibacter rhizovicinus]